MMGINSFYSDYRFKKKSLKYSFDFGLFRKLSRVSNATGFLVGANLFRVFVFQTVSGNRTFERVPLASKWLATGFLGLF